MDKLRDMINVGNTDWTRLAPEPWIIFEFRILPLNKDKVCLSTMTLDQESNILKFSAYNFINIEHLGRDIEIDVDIF